ncbi:TetR/AcrR family transcriptional regulator [Novosphingobium sp.]|uniref:TetR/AcrR family transcriptional regulator n=1 Tax=Novosphingobium sp. TaxID=1874826 RepID=UPI002626B4E3|nr:TetR/AcrR family transcriptional regulator [Novosphingobium sp.]
MVTILPRPADTIRRPRQKRSQQRFEAILDSADRLLETLEPAQISIYTLAEEAGLSAPSIYHFFPDAGQVFVALAERYVRQFVDLLDKPLPPGVTTWQAFFAARYGHGRDHYNAHGAARRLLLGSGLSASIRARDLENDSVLAERSMTEFCQLFAIAPSADLVERFTELLVINDAIWTLSVHRHGTITDAYDEQARLAREAYCSTFLPEHLPLRAAADQAA